MCKLLGWELGFEEWDKQALCTQGFNLSPTGQCYPINTGKPFIATEPGAAGLLPNIVTHEAPLGLWTYHFFRSYQNFEN